MFGPRLSYATPCAALLAGLAWCAPDAVASDLQADTAACFVSHQGDLLPCGGDADGDGYTNLNDCAPLDDAIHPGAPQSDSSVDDDCDGQVPASYQCGTTGAACLILPIAGWVRRREDRP
jgi:hypothetical protein